VFFLRLYKIKIFFFFCLYQKVAKQHYTTQKMMQEQASRKRSREEESQSQLFEQNVRFLQYIKAQLLNPRRDITAEELEDDQFLYEQEQKMDIAFKLPPMKGNMVYRRNPYLRYPLNLYPEVEKAFPFVEGIDIPCGVFEPYDSTSKPMLFRDDARKFWQAGPTADVEFKALYILQRQAQAHHNRTTLECDFEDTDELNRLRYLQTLPEPELDASEADVLKYEADMKELDSHLTRNDPLRKYPYQSPKKKSRRRRPIIYAPEYREDEEDPFALPRGIWGGD
jgi:hypothetical protein